jgi:hypothetical protein
MTLQYIPLKAPDTSFGEPGFDTFGTYAISTNFRLVLPFAGL